MYQPDNVTREDGKLGVVLRQLPRQRRVKRLGKVVCTEEAVVLTP